MSNYGKELIARTEALKRQNNNNMKISISKTSKTSQPMIGANKMPPAADTAALVALTTGRVVDAVLGAVAGVVGGAAMGATSYGAQGIAGGLTGLATNNSSIDFDNKGNLNNSLGSNGSKTQDPVQNINEIRIMMEEVKKIIRILGKKAGIDVDNPDLIE